MSSMIKLKRLGLLLIIISLDCSLYLLYMVSLSKNTLCLCQITPYCIENETKTKIQRRNMNCSFVFYFTFHSPQFLSSSLMSSTLVLVLRAYKPGFIPPFLPFFHFCTNFCLLSHLDHNCLPGSVLVKILQCSIGCILLIEPNREREKDSDKRVMKTCIIHVWAWAAQLPFCMFD